ncbi:hypothetical protein Cme02nite_72590 [Catellatospora methionotrophica]|uniref:Uncharacterized protein n=1 Tax=Catellatospora methionotrophica TaxID=121620 RepID=A0A8J3LDX5_9ACTN|nr:hypothetical protein [Catellatospora methionotrophica]GIG18927.1 hypothetical protein Cme02nite_72590 [Catellatospora methionotrophica]
MLRADLGGLGEDDLHVVAPSFDVWSHSRFALPPDPELPLTADVYVDGLPVDAVALLVRIRINHRLDGDA